MPDQRITTREFGVMTLNEITKDFYEAEVDLPFMKRKTISIAAADLETGLKRMHAFLAWLKVNHQTFKLPLELEIQNRDLVWDDVWNSILGEDWVDAEKGFLAEYLHYDSVYFHNGEIHLWVNTSGLHTDHMIRVTMNEAMEMLRCEML